MSRTWMALAAACLLGFAAPARADDQTIKLGVLVDLSSVYADFQGKGSVLAAQMAAEDFGGKVAGRKVEVLSADHQNKADVGANIARQWLDTGGVDAVLDLPNSAVALAVNQIVRDRNRVMIASGAGSSLLTGAQCSPNTVHWTYDTWALGHALAAAVVKEGGKSWFFITADYAFGHDLEKQAAEQVVKDGGRVLGSVRHPVGTNDFASFLLQAQASGADVVAFANAGGDLTNALKQSAEFGLGAKQKLVGLIFVLNNVPPLGLAAAKGLQTVSAFYWDSNEGTRAWAARFQARHPDRAMPNDMQAGTYAGVTHYLKAVAKQGSAADGRAVVAAMKAMPTDDPLFGQGSIRADGRKLHPMHLFQVKAPADSKGPWDVFTRLATVPADQAFRPLSAGGCALVN